MNAEPEMPCRLATLGNVNSRPGYRKRYPTQDKGSKLGNRSSYPQVEIMKLRKPEFDLGFLTIIWVIYAALMIYWIDIADRRLSLFGMLLICGIVSSIGIWMNVKLFGYVFAATNLVAAVLVVLVMLGYFVPDRPLSLKTIAATAFFPLRCLRRRKMGSA